MVTRVSGSGKDQVKTIFTRSKRSTWGPESPGMGEALVAKPTQQVQVSPTCRPESLDPGEALVGTGVTR